jgi:uncharacterized protein DUF6173
MAEKSEPGQVPKPPVSIPKVAFPKLPLPDFSAYMPPAFTYPDIDLPPSPFVTSVEANYASEFHKRLAKWINDFNESLDNEHEVGVKLVTFGQAVVFHLEDIGYWNPSLISFKGKTEEGNPVELIQHVTQISVLLTKLPRDNPDEPKRPIGFHPDPSDAA